MRFSALVAFLLPLAALAIPIPTPIPSTPSLVLVRRAEDAFEQLKSGLTDAKTAFDALFTEAIKPPRQNALADDTLGGRSALALLLSLGGPVDLLGGALQAGTPPSIDVVTQITNGIVTVNNVVVNKLEKDAKCTCATAKTVVCTNINKATKGLSSASKALADIVSQQLDGSKRR